MTHRRGLRVSGARGGRNDTSYERIISNEEDPARFKAERADVDAPKRWRCEAGRYANSDQAACDEHISRAKEGEAIFSVLENGRVEMFLFV